MKNITFFFEKLFYDPGILHRIVALLLLPFALLYGSIQFLKRFFSTAHDFNTPIISIGNLTVGGSGKTPFIIELANRYENCAVILRGYGRESKGMVEVSKNKEILTDVFQSGDEAMLIARSTNASVIVSEDRIKAIKHALKLGHDLILLDDAFSKANIKKYDILLFPSRLSNYLPLPSGPFREFYFAKKYADLILYEDMDFIREVNIINATDKMVLVTAIANPQRLDKYLPDGVIGKIYYQDHAYFTKDDLMKIMQQYDATSLLVTQKDLVKIDFDINLSVMQLCLKIDETILASIDNVAKTASK